MKPIAGPEVILQRFLTRIFKTDFCWLYNGPRTKLQYGLFRIGGRKGKSVYAHRYSFEIHCGPIPEGLCVLHHCDNPPCVNPDHLFLGTKHQNSLDMVAKGRASRKVTVFGEKHHSAKLSNSDVRAIREKYVFRKNSSRKLATLYGVSKTMILNIVRSKNWKHILSQESGT